MNNPKPTLPGTYQQIIDRFPQITDAHDQMSAAVEKMGPLDEKSCALIKIGIAVGAGLESAVRSHVRRAKHAGASELEIEQAIFLAMTTVGFPRAAAAYSWAHVQFERDRSET